MGRLGIYHGFDWLRLAGLALAYALLARLVLTFSSANGNVTIFWIPGGLALAALLAWGRRFWPAVYAGALAAGLMVDDPPWTSAVLALGNTLESLAAARLLRRGSRFDRRLESPRDFVLLALAGSLASAISALVGPLALWSAGYLAKASVLKNMVHWWQADVLGIVVGAPLFLVWRRLPREWLEGWRALEALLFFAAVFMAGQIIFLDWRHDQFGPIAQGYWIFLLVVLAALRYGPHGVLLAIAMVAVLALLGAIAGKGYFARDLPETGLENFWFSLLALTITGLALSLTLQAQRRAFSALSDSEIRFRQLFELIPDPIFVTGMEGRFLDASQSALEHLGYSREELLRMGPADIDTPEFAARVPARLAELRAQGQAVFESAHRRKDGTAVPVEIHHRRIRLGGEEAILSIARDLAERKRVEATLRESENRFRNLASIAPVVIYQTDAEGRCVFVNDTWEAVTGRPVESALGEGWAAQLHPEDRERVSREWRAAFEAKRDFYSEYRVLAADGSARDVVGRATANRGPDGELLGFVGTLFDITDKKASEERLWRQANFDILTGLPNRRMFHDRLAQEIKKSRRAGQPLALLFLDLDRFKEVNDTLGHEVGDELLVETARRLEGCVRQSDTVARLGGDEFTAILPGLGSAGGLDRIVQAILASLTRPYRLGAETAYISVSIGITLYPRDAADLPALLKNADQAMYAAKSQGRNGYSYFTPEMQRAAERRLRLANDLREALARGGFEVHYQPIVELDGGAARKAEALIRWRHPERGFVSPSLFIPLAEENGLIHDIGGWVFSQAAAQAKRLRERFDPRFQISVNKSPAQFQASPPPLADWLEQLGRLGLPGEAIALEITEGLLMDASQGVRAALLDMRDAGIQVAIDDFGTGYSALSYLKKFDIDYLKIDQSFVRNLAPGCSDLALCEAIVDMAHKLGLKVVAEGVETRAQRDLLQAIGCDFGQGFWFARPMPAEDFERWLAERRPGA